MARKVLLACCLFLGFCLLLGCAGVRTKAFVEDAAEAYTPPEGALVIFGDVIPSFAYTYPEEGLYLEWTDDKRSGTASLRFQWRAERGDWCGAGIGLAAPINLAPHREAGKLVFWIRGEKGLEEIRRVGFEDSNGYQSLRPLTPYGEITRDWQQITIPLAHFPDGAMRWDPALRREIPGTINWESIAQARFDFGEGTGGENTIYVDEMMILP